MFKMLKYTSPARKGDDEKTIGFELREFIDAYSWQTCWSARDRRRERRQGEQVKGKAA